MPTQRMGAGVILGKDMKLGENVIVWNYVVIGDNTTIDEGTRIGRFWDIGRNVAIGRNCNIQAHFTISNDWRISNNVFIAPNTTILNDRSPPRECLTAPTINDNAVVGGCVAILPDVVVGESVVIAAGSVVTKDVLSLTVVKGVPAKSMMTRKEYEAKEKNFVQKHLR